MVIIILHIFRAQNLIILQIFLTILLFLCLVLFFWATSIFKGCSCGLIYHHIEGVLWGCMQSKCFAFVCAYEVAGELIIFVCTHLCSRLLKMKFLWILFLDDRGRDRTCDPESGYYFYASRLPTRLSRLLKLDCFSYYIRRSVRCLGFWISGSGEQSRSINPNTAVSLLIGAFRMRGHKGKKETRG